MTEDLVEELCTDVLALGALYPEVHSKTVQHQIFNCLHDWSATVIDIVSSIA